VKEKHNLKAIADYVETSVAMMEANYCAKQGLNLTQISHSSQLTIRKIWLRGRDLNPVGQVLATACKC